MIELDDTELEEWVAFAAAIDAAIPAETKRGRASDEDDHYYGAWSGGKKSEGGHPEGASPSGDLASCKSIADVEAYVRGRYGYCDLTGLTDADLPTVKALAAEADRIATDFPQVLADPEWAFQGIGTYQSAACPVKVKRASDGAWAITESTHLTPGNWEKGGPVVWLTTNDLGEGTGAFGDIGFTFARTPVEAMTHEMGHVVHMTTKHAVDDFDRAIWDVYKDAGNKRVSPMRDVSIYAHANEKYAEYFTALNVPGGLNRLPSDAARTRVRAVRDKTNEGLAYDKVTGL